MSKNSLVDRIRVKEPCTQDWETMRGNDQVRFCDHCAKHVNDLSAMTRKQAMRLIRRTGSNICVRYIKTPATQAPLFADQLIQISRRAPRLAAGVMSASMSLATMAYAQGGGKTTDPKEPVAERLQLSPDTTKPGNEMSRPHGRTIAGTVLDQNGAVIPGAKVILGGAVDSRTVTTNDEGKYRFENVPTGNYLIQTESPGFRVQTTRILISDEVELKHDVGLEVGTIEVSVDIPLEIAMEVAVVGGAMFVSYSTPLNQAVADDDFEKVKELVAQGANVNGKDEESGKVTPIFIAVENGNLEIARFLLEQGAKVNVRDSERQTPLMRLGDNATKEMVELLLAHGAKIDQEDKEGNTALIIAAEYASAEVVEALLRGGADVNVSNKDGQTALMNAAYDDDLEKVRLLINGGADVNLKNDDGDTAWDLTSDEEVEALLVSFGARGNKQKNSKMDDHEEPSVEGEP